MSWFFSKTGLSFDAAWLYRKALTIDRTKVAADLINFPVLVSLTTDSDLAANAQADGDDIVFTLSDGVTIAPHDLELYTTATGKLVAWVRVRTLVTSVDTVIYMYYGNAACSAQKNPDATWAGSYVMVQHLGEAVGGSAPQFIDSAPVPTLASSFGVTSRWDTTVGVEAQSVATDGTDIWFTDSTTIFKYSKLGVLATSRSVSGDSPSTTGYKQINGIFIKDGVLYASVAKIESDVGTSYIVEYNPTTLAYITHHTLSGDNFSEAISYKTVNGVGYWWVCYHSHKYIGQYDASFNFVANHNVLFPITGTSGLGTGGNYGSQGYDGMSWQGDFLFLNIHEIYNQNNFDCYHWNGAGFDPVKRFSHVTSTATQGMAFDPVDSGVIWWVERESSGFSKVMKGTWTDGHAKNNGTVSGAPVQAAAKILDGVDFDGVDDHIAAGTNTRAAIHGAVTLSAWFRPDGAGTQYGAIVGKEEGSTSTGYVLQYNIANDGKLGGFVGNTSAIANTNGTTVLSIGTLYHVALVYDMSTVKVYLNGVNDSTTSQSLSGVAMLASSNPIYIARYKSSASWYTAGVLDEVRIAHTARSANWLLTEYRNQNSPSTFYAVGSHQVR